MASIVGVRKTISLVHAAVAIAGFTGETGRPAVVRGVQDLVPAIVVLSSARAVEALVLKDVDTGDFA